MIFVSCFLSFILIMVELYAFQALRTLIKLKWVWFLIRSLVCWFYIYIIFLQFDRSVGQTADTL
jgi:hypothetical protein